MCASTATLRFPGAMNTRLINLIAPLAAYPPMRFIQTGCFYVLYFVTHLQFHLIDFESVSFVIYSYCSVRPFKWINYITYPLFALQETIDYLLSMTLLERDFEVLSLFRFHTTS